MKELAIQPEIDAVAVANALWHTRCALAVAPQDTTAAFPGVRCYTAVQATEARRPPLRPGTGGDVLGCVFDTAFPTPTQFPQLGAPPKRPNMAFLAKSKKPCSRWDLLLPVAAPSTLYYTH